MGEQQDCTCMQDRIATVERVVCKVLLGQPESALENLGLAEGAADPRCNMTVLVQCIRPACLCHRPSTECLCCSIYGFGHSAPSTHNSHGAPLHVCQDSTALLCQLQLLLTCCRQTAYSNPGSVLSQSAGQSASSEAVMGQALDTSTGPSRAEAAAFVSNHSPDPQDLLPGLCLLTERWLHRVSAVSRADILAARIHLHQLKVMTCALVAMCL